MCCESASGTDYDAIALAIAVRSVRARRGSAPRRIGVSRIRSSNTSATFSAAKVSTRSGRSGLAVSVMNPTPTVRACLRRPPRETRRAGCVERETGGG